MTSLVSVIIPCYNAATWVSEAIDSCLKQTYSPLEVIVIDDGSSDSSLEIIRSYGNKVVFETGPNRGGNHARNRGFALSQGEYIQFLDADDYLLPEKIERQVKYLESTRADVVYGDWRYQYHQPSGKAYLDNIKVAGHQEDILKSLLSGWWISPACLLFRRQAVINSGGWDESLTAGQDRDFFTSVVISGAKVSYQSGCHSIYRRYGKTTVSTASKSRYLENHLKILEKNERQLGEQDKLSDVYSDALAQSYFLLARNVLNDNLIAYENLIEKVFYLSPKFEAKTAERTQLYRIAQKIIGFRRLEGITIKLKRFNRKNLI